MGGGGIVGAGGGRGGGRGERGGEGKEGGGQGGGGGSGAHFRNPLSVESKWRVRGGWGEGKACRYV